MIEPFWSRFVDWHLRTEHPWDIALHREAMRLSVEGLQRVIGEELLPAVNKAADAMRAFSAAYAKTGAQ